MSSYRAPVYYVVAYNSYINMSYEIDRLWNQKMEKYHANKQDKTSLLRNRIVYDNKYHDQN